MNQRPATAQTRNEQSMVNRSRKLLETTSDPVEKLRLQLLSRGSTGIMGFGRVFRRMDDDGSKALNMKEFKKGIEDSGLKLNDNDMSALFKAFDSNNSGSIDFDEFLGHIRPAMSQARRNVLMEAYRKMDVNGDGHVTLEDIRQTYSVERHPQYQSGEKTRDQILLQYMANFENPDSVDGKVTKDEFIDYYSAVSASIDQDAYFDLMIRSAYKL